MGLLPVRETYSVPGYNGLEDLVALAEAIPYRGWYSGSLMASSILAIKVSRMLFGGALADKATVE